MKEITEDRMEWQKRLETNNAIHKLCMELKVMNHFKNPDDAHALELLCEEQGISCYVQDYYDNSAGLPPYDKVSHYVVQALVV